MIRNRLLAPAALALSSALGIACTPTTTTTPADPSTDAATFGSGDLPPGSHVQVNKNGQWLPAKIVQPLGGGRFIVGYDGYGTEWNEAVAQERIRTPGAPPPAARDYRAGEKVLVTSQGRTVLGDVVQWLALDQWRVHYDGYGPEASETVGPDRIRRPFQGASVHNAGDAVTVDVNGQAMPGKVIALAAADRWLVRYDGYGPQYDQEVGADRVRNVVAPPPAPLAPLAAVEPPAPVAPAVEPPKPEKGKKKKDKEKPEKADPLASAPPAPAAAASAPLQAGDAVLVAVRNASHAATITAPGAAPGSWKVKFESGGEDEVAGDRVIRFVPAPKGVKYAPQQAVMVEWHGLWVPGKVLKDADKSSYKVRFDGQAPEADEIVPARRLRPRQ
jgi:Agenet domain